MGKNIQKIYGPEYLKDFSCIASRCKETCCKSWVVNVDKKTYRMYKKVKDPELREIINKHISKPGIWNFGGLAKCKIQLNNDGLCPFLDDKYFCKMQLKYGENYIPSVCCTYPRIINIVDGKHEMSLNTSCLEAARVMLLNKEPMKFVEIGEMDIKKYYIRAVFNSDRGLFLVWHKKYFHLYRNFAIDLFRNRSIRLSERLLILGLFCVRIDNLIWAKNFSQIPEFIDSFYEKTDTKAFLKEYSSIAPDYFFQIRILRDLSENLGSRNTYEKYMELYDEFLEELLGYEDNSPTEEIIKKYKESTDKHYVPFVETNDYFFENYLVNYIYKKLFPFYNPKGFNGLYDSFVIMVAHYSIIKFHLICAAASRKELTPELALEVVFLFSRTFEHNQKYFTDVLNLLKRERHNDFKCMIKLIGND